MTELDKILLTSGLTIVGGSLVFVIQRFVLEPLNDQSRALGRISFAIYYYGREYNLPINPEQAEEPKRKHYEDVSDRLRELGSSLAETSQGIRLYWFWSMLRMTPRRKNIDEAIGRLTRISNSMFNFDSTYQMAQIRQNWADADDILKFLGLRKWGK